MKILERKELPIVGNCPSCGSKLELERGDIWWHYDIDGCSSPYVTCAVCNNGFDVEGWKNISKLY